MASEQSRDSAPTISEQAHSRQLALVREGFEQGAAEQRARRETAGLGPLAPTAIGRMQPLGASLLAFLEAIPWQDGASDAPSAPETPDGGPFCATCRGARWLVQRGAGWSPPLVRCPDCGDLTRTARRASLALAAGLSERQQSKTFASWRPIRPAAAALRAAVLWSGEWSVAPEAGDTPWLVLSGARGSGKTHLGLAAANAHIHALRPVRWFHTVDLVDLARARAADGGALAFRRELEDAVPLVLDEFGALSAMATDWAISGFIEPLLDARYRSACPTLFTLQAGPSEIRAGISDSIGRRMQDSGICTWVENGAPQFTGGRAA